MNKLMIAIPLLITAACEASKSNDSGDETKNCSDYSADECPTHSCSVLTGSPVLYDAEAECIVLSDAVVGLACVDPVQTCMAVESLASPGGTDVDLHLFSSSCIPDDWEHFNGAYSECTTRTEDCWELDVDACGSEPMCTFVSGSPLTENEEGTCFYQGEMTAVGCMPADEACEPVVLFASPNDGSDTIHIFPGSCIPRDWETVNILEFEICDDIPLSVCDPTYSDPLTILSLSHMEQELRIDVQYNGGCIAHEYQACWNGVTEGNNPPQVNIALGHNANDDECDGLVTESVRVHVSSLIEQAGTPLTVNVGDQSITLQ